MIKADQAEFLLVFPATGFEKQRLGGTAALYGDKFT